MRDTPLLGRAALHASTPAGTSRASMGSVVNDGELRLASPFLSVPAADATAGAAYFVAAGAPLAGAAPAGTSGRGSGFADNVRRYSMMSARFFESARPA